MTREEFLKECYEALDVLDFHAEMSDDYSQTRAEKERVRFIRSFLKTMEAETNG